MDSGRYCQVIQGFQRYACSASIKRSVFLIALILGVSEKALPWGFHGHRICNKQAVYALPPEMFGFFKNYIDYLTEHSVDPDKRRYALPEEACRHYLDADRYEKAIPFDTIPHFWRDAVKKYTADTLQTHGIVPWHVNVMYYRLKEAFAQKDLRNILRNAADIGHYIADAHVPLHSTSNYNGQKTGQNGIHGLWESRVLELYSGEYDYFTGRAVYIENVQQYMWQEMEGSYQAVDSVLTFERELSSKVGDDAKYTFEQRGNTTVRTYSREFCRKYHDMLGDQVERRIRSAIAAIASVWYTAWVDAGMPDLTPLYGTTPADEESLPPAQDKMIGRPED